MPGVSGSPSMKVRSNSIAGDNPRSIFFGCWILGPGFRLAEAEILLAGQHRGEHLRRGAGGLGRAGGLADRQTQPRGERLARIGLQPRRAFRQPLERQRLRRLASALQRARHGGLEAADAVGDERGPAREVRGLLHGRRQRRRGEDRRLERRRQDEARRPGVGPDGRACGLPGAAGRVHAQRGPVDDAALRAGGASTASMTV